MPVKFNLKFFHKHLIYLLIFINGFKLILPIDITDDDLGISTPLPFWATNFDFHGIYLSDILFMLYFFLYGFRYSPSIFKGRLAMFFFYFITGLSISGFISTLTNFEIFTDYFEAARLAMLALFFLYVVWWTNLFGEVIILRIFLLSLLCSGIVNLFFTFFFSVRLLGGLPQLLGQNGPASSAGFLLFCSAWLFIASDKRLDKILAIVFIIVDVFILIISYSKLGMLMGLCGCIAFFAALFSFPSLRAFRIRIFYLIISLTAFIFWLTQSEKGNILIEGATTFYYYKLGGEGAGLVEKEGGDQERLYYYYAVGEVFMRNPIFGVGYNGFGPAVSQTKVHESGLMAEEESFINANPHNVFLYYISANGTIGWVFTICLFGTFLFVFYKIFIPMGITGLVIFISIFLASLIHTNTTIGFFNTTVMYLPTAIGISMLQRCIDARILNYSRKIILENPKPLA